MSELKFCVDNSMSQWWCEIWTVSADLMEVSMIVVMMKVIWYYRQESHRTLAPDLDGPALGLVPRLRLGSATPQVAPPWLRSSRICSPDAHPSCPLKLQCCSQSISIPSPSLSPPFSNHLVANRQPLRPESRRHERRKTTSLGIPIFFSCIASQFA
jgi:hypothetical protein